MNDDGVKFVQPIRVVGVVNGIEQPEFHGKRNTIGELDVFLKIVLIFEPFEVESQDVRELFNFHPLLSFLKITATVTEEFVLLTQHLASAELTEASRDGRILLDVDREV